MIFSESQAATIQSVLIRAAKEKTDPLSIEWEFTNQKDIFGIGSFEIIVTEALAV